MHKKNLSFFTMLENEEYTTLTIFNNTDTQHIEYLLTKEWSKTAVWKGEDSQGLLKKAKKANQELFTEMITKYSLQEYLRDIVSLMKSNKHKKLIFIFEPKNNIRCILACHNTNKDYVVGGFRRALEAQSEWQVISDTLCLSRGMSFRCAVAGLPCSGISLAVHGNAPVATTVNEFFGFIAYILNRFEIFVAVEGGFSGKDIALLKSYTTNCVSEENESKNNIISLAATYSVYTAIKNALLFRYPNNGQIQGKTIAIQGLGSIGSSLATKLLDEGAELIIGDIDERKVEQFVKGCSRPKSVVVEEFNSVTMQMGHVFAPCAFSGVIDRDTMSNFDYHIVTGGANNIMSEPIYEDEIALANLLMKKDIIYIPDWISNFGGATHGVSLFMDKNSSLKKTKKKIDSIMARIIKQLLTESKQKNISHLELAYRKFEPKI
ncbi:hypothetical protein [Candidatus Uabimicrobium sp. HlEnr_7]|uniref:hypothetical protein n=1 Tax=Candidatus Uabimicrobium helgolandensis TaxID=3095367 RepID=UPI003557B702